jgi:hypothetical protein
MYRIWTPTEPRKLHKITGDPDVACDFAASGYNVEILEDRDGSGYHNWHPISAKEIDARIRAGGVNP